MNLAGIELALTQYLDQCIRMCGKKLKISIEGNNDSQLDKLNEMLNSFHNYVHFNMENENEVEPLIGFSGDDLEAIKSSVFYYLDRLKYEYGRVANTNPKGERITSGENYKDISAIANRQKETLEYLHNFAIQVQKLWSIELDFAVSGIPEKEAVYTMSHEAETPNTEKQMAGQIEGTQPRPPRGQGKGNKPAKWSN